MELDVQQRRPIARLAAHGALQRPSLREQRAGPYAPPATVIHDGLGQVPADVAELCVRLVRGIVLGEDLSRVHSRLAPDVVTWSPRLFTVSRDQLLTHDCSELAGETLSEVVLDATSISATQSRVYVEWRMTARFTGPGFIDDDLLIEPTGHLLEAAGVAVIAFSGHQVVSTHCYYDDLALFEQLITSRSRL